MSPSSHLILIPHAQTPYSRTAAQFNDLSDIRYNLGFDARTTNLRLMNVFMDKCDNKKLVLLGGAVVYSHRNQEDMMYSDKIDCQITFKADDGASKVMMQIVNMDLPDQSYNKLCNDALYVYDGHNIFGRTLKQAGGTGGLCGKRSSTVINSSSEFLTLYFRTDNGGPSGQGFKLIVTSYSDEYAETSSCGQRFECRNQKCIDHDLLCDRVDHCGDYSDEQPDSYSQCELQGHFHDGVSQSPERGASGLSKFKLNEAAMSIAWSCGHVVTWIRSCFSSRVTHPRSTCARSFIFQEMKQTNDLELQPRRKNIVMK
ncbi:hypothetical protein CAPTEDRAFT_223728 [Capitella teleta]|uniref:CUB domain-containing protein n=1 Tax=Capitella teleta TaxID=283909 RepID=R7U1U6_CAPTE|nr:hypothetical protein CAPTEDRAFT_223728 [Capitella teleta]|eukprot:ELT99959.1 hypothetical protein CAPTEDRAFT_223728 [Capitella teleta]